VGERKVRKCADTEAIRENLEFGDESNSNSLANQLGIHLILAKREKLPSNSLANQPGKNRNMAKTHLPTRIYARAYRVAIGVSL
jgi:hypothetical protein